MERFQKLINLFCLASQNKLNGQINIAILFYFIKKCLAPLLIHNLYSCIIFNSIVSHDKYVVHLFDKNKKLEHLKII